MVSDEPRAASVICVTEGRLKRFPRDPFEEMFRANDPIATKVVYNMCRILAQRLSRLEKRFVSEVWKVQAGN